MNSQPRTLTLAYHTLKTLCTLALLTFLTACPEGIDPSLAEERCTDGLDNNGDGLVDCEDPACALFATCTGNEHCYNGVDDNGDGKIDCEEESCKALFICLQDIEDCSNGRDDDDDELIDCQDSACANTSVCKSGAEACTGGIDEDKDGDIDCDDEDCKSVFVCLQRVEIPGNGVDDDGDGKIDCDDADIANTSSCLDGKEICDDSLDNDSDGTTDCDDADCAQTSFCLAPAEVCDNGIDDDNDGDIDCDDSNCRGRAICLIELCDNGRDDDRNGTSDCEDPACRYTENCLMEAPPAAELCHNGVDDDGDGDTDCDDLDCSSEQLCQPEVCDDEVDNNGDGHIDCADASCAEDISCQCQAFDKLTDPVSGLLIDDCSRTQCHPYFGSCQTGLAQELCQGDGVDNDGDGLVDCEDPDCQDFSDDDAYCTRALCGDPDHDYMVLDFADTSPDEPLSELYITRSEDFQTTIAASQATVYRGDIHVETFDGSPFSLDSPNKLRCVLPHPTIDEIKGKLSLDTQTLLSTPALANITVLGQLVFKDDAAYSPSLSDLASLSTILDDFEYVVPYYPMTPPTPKTFEGLEALRRIGGHFILNYYGRASNDIQPRAFSMKGLEGLVEVGGDLWKRRDYYDAQDDALYGCRVEIDPMYPDYQTFEGTFITLDSTMHLDALRRVGGTICFAPSALMTDLSGLARLEHVGGNFFLAGIEGSALPISLAGLEQLSHVEGILTNAFLRIESSRSPRSLISLTSLSSLESVGSLMLYLDDDFQDFDGLQNLREIRGDLSLQGDREASTPTLISLDGLNNVTHIDGAFSTRDLDMIDFTGLDSLQSIHSITIDISTWNMLSFESFAGLDALQTISKRFNLSSSLFGPELPSLSNAPFTALTSLTFSGTLNIERTPNLDSLTGLDNLARLGTLRLIGTPLLDDLSPLSSITTLGVDRPNMFAYALELRGTGLTSLDDLSALTTIQAEVSIQENTALADIDQLEALTSFSAPFVSISNNPALSQCLVDDAITHLMSLDPNAFYTNEGNMMCP